MSLNLVRFKWWLVREGIEILPNTNEYEAVRFKGKATGVIYKSGKTSGQYAQSAIKAFQSGKKWNGRPVSTGRKNNYRKEKVKLLERDGSNCFYCHKPLEEDITVEHLLSLTAKGPNTLGNMVLAHEQCNKEAGNKTIAEKVRISISNLKTIHQ